MSGSPHPAPCPKTLALLCSVRSWEDDVDDDSRQLLEWSHDVIESLCSRLERQALHLERAEAAVHPHWPLLEPEDDPGLGL